MIEEFKKDYIKICVPSTEHAYLLMDITEHLGCEIKKYYWRSKWDPDREYIEEIEPKCPDAFEVIIEITGDMDMLGGVYDVYKNKSKLLDNLPSMCSPYTEEEIKHLAYRFISVL